jgi:O-antigen ligase
MLIALLAISWAVKSIFFSRSDTLSSIPKKQLTVLIISFLLVLLWAFIQTLTTIPSGWIHPLWPIINDTLSTNSQGTISLNRDDTLTSIMRLISYALVFWLSQHYCQHREKAKQVFFCLMLAGFVYSLFGLIIYLGGFDSIIWQHKWSAKTLSSTFVNRNHFATYAGLTLICSLALISESVQVSNRYKLGGFIGLQRFLENLISRTWLPLLAFFIIGTALILTHSRGGFLSTLLAILVLLAALNLIFQTRNIHFLSVVGIFIIIGGWMFYVSGDILTNRFDRLEVNSINRIRVFQITWNAITDNPWLGYGYGCFQEAFAVYKTIDIAGSRNQPLLWDYAHNTYLETMFELGIPAAFALFLCFVKLALDCLKGLFIRKRDLIFPAAGLAATALIASHAIIDFSIQIPAVAYTYALLMGAAWAQSFSSRTGQQ